MGFDNSTKKLTTPFNLASLSQATGNPILDLGYQCCDMSPYFLCRGVSNDIYVRVHPLKLVLNNKINLYKLEANGRNVDGISYDKMTYIGSGTIAQDSSGELYISTPQDNTYTQGGNYTPTQAAEDEVKNIRGFFINKWAWFKPLPIGSESADYGEGGANASSRTDGLTWVIHHPPITTGGYTTNTYINQYQYNPPTIGNGWCRMLDFNGYKKDAEAPLKLTDKFPYNKNGVEVSVMGAQSLVQFTTDVFNNSDKVEIPYTQIMPVGAGEGKRVGIVGIIRKNSKVFVLGSHLRLSDCYGDSAVSFNSYITFSGCDIIKNGDIIDLHYALMSTSLFPTLPTDGLSEFITTKGTEQLTLEADIWNNSTSQTPISNITPISIGETLGHCVMKAVMIEWSNLVFSNLNITTFFDVNANKAEIVTGTSITLNINDTWNKSKFSDVSFKIKLAIKANTTEGDVYRYSGTFSNEYYVNFDSSAGLRWSKEITDIDRDSTDNSKKKISNIPVVDGKYISFSIVGWYDDNTEVTILKVNKYDLLLERIFEFENGYYV